MMILCMLRDPCNSKLESNEVDLKWAGKSSNFQWISKVRRALIKINDAQQSSQGRQRVGKVKNILHKVMK